MSSRSSPHQKVIRPLRRRLQYNRYDRLADCAKSQSTALCVSCKLLKYCHTISVLFLLLFSPSPSLLLLLFLIHHLLWCLWCLWCLSDNEIAHPVPICFVLKCLDVLYCDILYVTYNTTVYRACYPSSSVLNREFSKVVKPAFLKSRLKIDVVVQKYDIDLQHECCPWRVIELLVNFNSHITAQVSGGCQRLSMQAMHYRLVKGDGQCCYCMEGDCVYQLRTATAHLPDHVCLLL